MTVGNLDLGWLAVIRQVLEARGIENPNAITHDTARALRDHRYAVMDCANHDQEGRRIP